MEIGDTVKFFVKKTELIGEIIGVKEKFYFIKSGPDTYYIEKNSVIKIEK